MRGFGSGVRVFTSLVCPLRGAREEPPVRGGGVCDGWASSVPGVVPRCGPHLDHRIHLRLPADDHRWSGGHLLLHQVSPTSVVLCCRRHDHALHLSLHLSFSASAWRNKSQLPATPILSSVVRTIRYHLGTLAKGSFIITLVKIPRLILTYMHTQLKGKVSSVCHLSSFFSF